MNIKYGKVASALDTMALNCSKEPGEIVLRRPESIALGRNQVIVAQRTADAHQPADFFDCVPAFIMVVRANACFVGKEDQDAFLLARAAIFGCRSHASSSAPAQDLAATLDTRAVAA